MSSQALDRRRKPAPLTFQLYPLRFTFVARQPVHFPVGKPANLLRGAFGVIFRSLVCVPQCVSANACELRASCPYAQLFEPRASEAGPSGLLDRPRPFVFRAMHLDGRTVVPGEFFSFDLNLFELSQTAIAYLVLAFAQLGREGLGPGRGRAELVEVAQLDASGEVETQLFERGASTLHGPTAPMQLSLAPATESIEHVTVRFVSPTELKAGQRLAARPESGILMARIRDRISTLRELYGGGPLDLDFRAFGERAARVRLARCDWERVDVARTSSRTGQVHAIGGFVGEAEYEGDLAEFLPFLRAARWTGVGRQTVWGKGEIRVLEA